MWLFRKLWHDDLAMLLSAEAVVVGTVGVVGLTTGLTVVAQSVNSELQDLAFATRSLDQSYSIPAHQCCGAHTAGSSFTQEPVEKSLDELRAVIKKAEKQEKAQAERLEQQVKEQERKKEPEKKKEMEKKKKKDQNI